MTNLTEILSPLPVEQLFKSEISFNGFLQEIYPGVQKSIFPVIENVIGRFESFCTHDTSGNFAKIRGGAMRRFIFKTTQMDEIRRVNFRGNETLTQKVIDYTFPGNTDLDIRFDFTETLTHDQIRKLVRKSLPVNQTYEIEFESFDIGSTHLRPVEKVYFKDKKTHKIIFILDLAGRPKTLTEIGEDLKDSEDAVDVDRLAQGEIRRETNGLSLHYGTFEALEEMTLDFFNKDTKYNGFNVQMSVKDLIVGFREASFRGYYIAPMLGNFQLAGQEIPNLLKMMVGVWNSKQQQDPKLISDWIENHRSELEKDSRLLPLLSSALFCLTVPILGLPMAYFNGYLAYTPLGKIIGDRPKILMGILAKVAEQNGGNIIEDNAFSLTFNQLSSNRWLPFVIVDYLKEKKLIPVDLPTNPDTVVRLVNPLFYNNSFKD